jgi:sec-independent protein translocase protein TatA
MPFIGGGHIWLMLILLVIVLIVWGPGKLPEMGAGIGRAIREFRHASSEVREQISLNPVTVNHEGSAPAAAQEAPPVAASSPTSL